MIKKQNKRNNVLLSIVVILLIGIFVFSTIKVIKYIVELRHTCATLLYRAGVNIKTIQELLGHVQIDTTEIYTHLDNQEVKNVMFNHPLAQFKMVDALAYCA